MTTAGVSFDWFRYAGSLALVLLLLAGMLVLLRKLKGMQSAQQVAQRLQLLETISIGPRQKISLLRVGSVHVLIGATAGQITPLAQWPQAGTTGTDLVS